MTKYRPSFNLLDNFKAKSEICKFKDFITRFPSREGFLTPSFVLQNRQRFSRLVLCNPLWKISLTFWLLAFYLPFTYQFFKCCPGYMVEIWKVGAIHHPSNRVVIFNSSKIDMFVQCSIYDIFTSYGICLIFLVPIFLMQNWLWRIWAFALFQISYF